MQRDTIEIVLESGLRVIRTKNPNEMSYNKENNKYFKNTDSISAISEMIYQLNNAKDHFLQVRELPMYKDLFTEGEKGSIDAIIKQIEYRTKLSHDLQKSFYIVNL
jgi:hypothetical protein